jgi:hypothetical protein
LRLFHLQCQERGSYEPEQSNVHYIYEGESCDCPRYHDVIVQKPEEEKKHRHHHKSYKYEVEVPKSRKQEQEDEKRYIFDVRVEKPVEEAKEER